MNCMYLSIDVCADNHLTVGCEESAPRAFERM